MLFCSQCNLTFKTKKGLTAHFDTKKHLNSNKENKYKCGCGKSYSHRQGLHTHKKTCDFIPTTENEPEIEYTEVQSLKNENNEMKEIINKKEEEIKEIINKKDQEIREMLAKKDLEMDELRKKVETLFASSSGNTTNIENQNVTQNVFIVNNFGNENTDYLSDKGITKLMSRNGPYVCIPKLIRSIHFHPKHPENHNIQVTNIGKNYAKIFTDNKWEVRNKNRTIDDLIVTTGVLLREKFEENKSCLSANQKERYNTYENDKTLMKNIKSEVDITLINGTNEIFKK